MATFYQEVEGTEKVQVRPFSSKPRSYADLITLDKSQVLFWFDTFGNICQTNGIKKQSDICLLCEGYRRFMMFNIGKPMETAWVGLGSPSKYKGSKFFVSVGEETKRVSNWYTFSKEGAEIMGKILAVLPLPSNKQAENEINRQIFGV